MQNVLVVYLNQILPTPKPNRTTNGVDQISSYNFVFYTSLQKESWMFILVAPKICIYCIMWVIKAATPSH